MYPAIFLDRDGVIIENRPSYVRSWADVDIYPQALQALAQAASSPYKVVIVTNQAAIGKGFLPLATAGEINRRLLDVIADTGGRVDGVYLCPHTPDDTCSCRKPLPGLLIRAAQELSLDLTRSILVGDALSDLLAGQAAGIPRLALVRTGRGAEQLGLAERALGGAFVVYDNLQGALGALIPGSA